MARQQKQMILMRDLIDTTHRLAKSPEKIVTRFEQLSRRIDAEKELSAVTAQFAGLNYKAEDPPHGLASSSDER